jgi:hypothetical protein
MRNGAFLFYERKETWLIIHCALIRNWSSINLHQSYRGASGNVSARNGQELFKEDVGFK